MEQFEKQIVVAAEHLDELNHVNNVVFLQWVQEISKEHWQLKVPVDLQEKYFWVVRSHTIEYKKQAFLGDTLIAKTYVSNCKGPFSERIVSFYNEDKRIVETKSNWCLLDVFQQKPTRVPEEIQRLFGLK